jgi:hypothetical protein
MFPRRKKPVRVVSVHASSDNVLFTGQWLADRLHRTVFLATGDTQRGWFQFHPDGSHARQ